MFEGSTLKGQQKWIMKDHEFVVVNFWPGMMFLFHHYEFQGRISMIFRLMTHCVSEIKAELVRYLDPNSWMIFIFTESVLT